MISRFKCLGMMTLSVFFTSIDICLCIIGIYFLKKHNFFQTCDSLDTITFFICILCTDFGTFIAYVIYIINKSSNSIIVPHFFNCVLSLTFIIGYIITFYNNTTGCRYSLIQWHEICVLFWCYIGKSICITIGIILTITLQHISFL